MSVRQQINLAAMAMGVMAILVCSMAPARDDCTNHCWMRDLFYDCPFDRCMSVEVLTCGYCSGLGYACHPRNETETDDECVETDDEFPFWYHSNCVAVCECEGRFWVDADGDKGSTTGGEDTVTIHECEGPSRPGR
jgi:hypothetical protein